MKVWALHGFGLNQLRFEERPVPKPTANEVLIRIASVSLNYRDKLLYDGLYNPELRFPIVPVADAAGEVVEVGGAVNRFRIGDKVVTQYATKWIDGDPQDGEYRHTLGNTISGALAEYIVLDEQALVAKPEYLSDDEASTLPVAAVTVWNALVCKGNLKPGDTVLLQGTGGVSIFALQLSTALGAKAIVISSSDEKLRRVQELGAAHGINYSRFPEWQEKVLELTDQRGVDHVMDVVGGESLNRSLKAARPGGNVFAIGLLDGLTSTVELFRLLTKQVNIQGITTGSRAMFEKMNKTLTQLKLRPVIDSVYPFANALSAFHHLERGAFGKIVIRVRS